MTEDASKQEGGQLPPNHDGSTGETPESTPTEPTWTEDPSRKTASTGGSPSPEPPSSSSPPEEGSEARTEWGSRQKWMIGTNVLVMITLAAAIYIGANYIGSLQYTRQDWTEEGLFTLSPETVSVLQSLDREVEVINFYRPGPGTTIPQRIQRQVRVRVDDLLEEYLQHTDKLIVKNIDIDKDPAEAQLLLNELEVDRANLTVFRIGSGETSRQTRVSIEDVAILSGGQNPASLREQASRLLAFRGEEQFTSAIRAVLEERASKVLFTTGHGEMSPEDFDATSGFSGCAAALRQNNYEVDLLNLFQAGSVPSDCDLLIVAAPERDFVEGEIQAVKSYRDQGGNLMIMLRQLSPSNVLNLVDDLGITAAPVDVIAADSVNFDYFNGQFYLRVSDGLSRSHDITRALAEQGLFVIMPFVRPLFMNPQTGWNTEKILQSYGRDQAWGERIVEGKPNMVKDPGEISGPLTLGITLVKATENPDAPKPRVLVLGDADFASNVAINAASNKDLLTNCFDWLTDKGLYYDIAPKVPTARLIQLDKKSSRAFLWLWLGMTGLLGIVLGVLVWLIRRS